MIGAIGRFVRGALKCRGTTPVKFVGVVCVRWAVMIDMVATEQASADRPTIGALVGGIGACRSWIQTCLYRASPL